jgi:hypothetical protein
MTPLIHTKVGSLAVRAKQALSTKKPGPWDRVSNPFNQAGGAFARYSNPAMIAALDTYCAIKKIKRKQLDVSQGCWHTGYKPSAGTHDKSCCKDLSAYDATDKVWTLNLIGVGAEHRTPEQGFSPHVHCWLCFGGVMAWLAHDQDVAYRAHKSNGLGNLSHNRTAKTPRYWKTIRHVGGPETGAYMAHGEVVGYSQPGGTPTRDKDLVVKGHPKGWVLKNVAGTVEADGRVYLVDTDRIFWLRTDFMAWTSDWVPETVTYEVVAATVGQHGPGGTTWVGTERAPGYRIKSVGHTTKNRIYIATQNGVAYRQADLKVVA